MRVESTHNDYGNDADGDALTTVYWKPEDHAPPPEPRMSPYPAVRSYEVPDRFAIPTPLGFAPPPVLFAPTRHPRATRQDQTIAVRRIPSSILGLGFAGLCVLVGITIGGVIVLSGGSSSTAHATSASVIAKPMIPVAAPVVAPITVTAAQPALVTVRVESNPPGATAMLVDNGKNTLVGVTPIDASLDGTRQYDLVLTLDNHDTRIVHVDPATQKQIAVELAETVAEAAPIPAPVAPVTHRRHAAPAVHARAARAVVAAPVVAATGTLVVSSKPPTSIIVDGKPTGLTTPHKSLTLAAGRHQITLTNAGEGISLTTEVDIIADHPTRLVQDFTK